MIRRILRIVSVILIALPAFASPKGSYTWVKLADGFLYASYGFAIDEATNTTIHAFSIDPKKFKIDVLTSKNEVEGATAGELARAGKAILAINGGFFTPEHKTIGLIIKDGREISPVHKTSWWSIFAMDGTTPRILTQKEFKDVVAGGNVRTALQVGPRLVVGGSIPKLKESIAARSAVGITKDGKLVIAITQGPGISMNELANRMMKSRFDGGLECPDAMALDGGSSSQLYAKIGKFELSLPGLVRITNALAIMQK